jgi:pimeloyl-ACP methyl ester carboxylesterase
VRPFPYREEEVTYRNEAAQIRLAGTLTLPPGSGPFPAVLLITGSGAQDRDETIAGHKPFLLLSDTFTRRGLAVLRVDDRGVGGSDRGPLTATSQDFAGDVRGGVAYLRSRSEIDPARIGLLGHSEGGNIAVMVAADAPEIAFIVMMAGAGISGDEILLLQAEALGRLQGASAAVVAWDRAIRERVYDLVKAESNGLPDEARRRALIENSPAAPGDTGPSGQKLAATLLQGASGSWFRHFLAYDPAPTISRVRCPVLAVIGDNDVQVPARENLPAIQAALKAGGNRDATVTNVPRLNHLFQTSVTGSPAEYATIEETIAPAALTLIADWIVARARP